MRLIKIHFWALLFCFGASGSFAQNNNNTPPAFKGGEDSLMIFLVNNIQKPDCEKSPEIDSAVDVTVNVHFIIDAHGNAVQLKSDSKCPQCFIDEAIRTIRLTSGKWIPGTVNGVFVDTQCILPISFAKK